MIRWCGAKIPAKFYNKAYLTCCLGKDTAGIVFNSDSLKRGFLADLGTTRISEVAVNANGEVVGIFNGLWLVSDALKQSLSLYLVVQIKSRPAFGFSYLIITRWKINSLE